MQVADKRFSKTFPARPKTNSEWLLVLAVFAGPVRTFVV